MNNELKPKIRFKGFTDDWEQRKLKDITSIITKGTTPLDKSGNGDINFIKIENINPSTGLIESTTKITEEEHNGYLRRSQLKENDLLFSIAGTLGRVSLINKEILPANTNQALAIIRLKECDLNYIKTFLKGKAISDFIKKNPTIGAQPNLSLEQVSNFEISYPEDTEAHKIGTMLDSLDNLITLHQRKYDKLIELKKSLLEKMFPQNNSVIPEIRFKGFTDDWEQRKLEEIGDNFSTRTLGYADLIEDGKYKCVLYGDLYTKFNERIFNVKSRTNREATKTEVNDILFPTSTTVDSVSLIAPSCINQENIMVGGDLFGIRPYKNIDGNFISYYINNFIPVKHSFAKQAQGLTIVHLQYNAVKKEDLMIPTLEEQKIISQLFISIDNLITLHQRKHDKLNKIKQSLLNDMFV